MSVEKIQNLIELVQSNEDSSETCSSIVQDLQRGHLTFLKLTENLECLLTSSDIVIRRGGSEALSMVLKELPNDFLKSEEIDLLTNFFCERMLDHHSITPAVLKAFLALLRMNNLPSGTASKIFSTMNLHFVCQSQTQPDRLTCYEIFNAMVTRKSSELLALGPDFVCGYLAAIDSERDPRNLTYLFKNLPYFFHTFPPGHLLEDAFEAISCYFPIDFRTNPNDPRGISREDLSNALLPCLTALPEFAPFAVPLALDKLSSDLEIAKIDSLLLLKQCFSQFPKDAIYSYTSKVVTALIDQLRLAMNKENLIDRIVDGLCCIIQFLAKNDEKELENVLQEIYSGVHYFLNDIHLNAFKQTVQLLAKISSASSISNRYVTSKVLPKLLAICCKSSQQSINLLLSLKLILSSCVVYNINCAEISELKNLWFKVPQLFLQHCECDDPELKETAFVVCASLIKLMNVEERKSLYITLSRNILLESNDHSRLQFIIHFKTIAESYPEEIHDIVESVFETSTENDIERRRRTFQCYCIMATVPGFGSYLHEAVKMNIKSDSFECAFFTIQSLKAIVIREKQNRCFLNILHDEINVTKHLMNWWYEGCNAIADDIVKIFDDEHVAVDLQYIISVIVRELDKNSQQDIATLYFQLALDYSKKFMNSFAYLNTDNSLDSPKVHCSFSIITFESVVNGLLPEVLEESFKGCLTQILKYLVTLAVYCSRSLCCTVACRSIATVFNKMQPTSDLENEIAFVLSYIRSVISLKSVPLKNNAVNLLLYVTKALLLKGDINTNACCDQLVELIKNEQVGNTVAQGFRMIVTEDEYLLSDSCHCKTKLFYRQRIFSHVIPKLVDLCKNSDVSVKQRCAFSTLYLLDGIPQAVILKYFKKIVPLLIQLLEVESNSDLIDETLRKLVKVLDSNPPIFEEYVETFIPKLLLLSRNAKQMNVRMAALECLYSYGKLNAVSVLPFKTKVLQELSHCLDDTKRLVRKKAVKTRTRWFIIGA